MEREFQMAPAPDKALWSFRIINLFLLLMILCMTATYFLSTDFPLWSLGLLVLLTVPTGALILCFSHMTRHVKVEVSHAGVCIKATFYGRTIPTSSIALDEVRVVDLTNETDLRIRWKTNGASVPGFQAGWFRLKNRAKALCFVTDETRVVYVPTRETFVVLLSVDDPEDFVQALHKALS